MHLNMAAVLVLSKCQAAENMEKTADLLRTQVVHVVQNSLDRKNHGTQCFSRGKNSDMLTNFPSSSNLVSQQNMNANS